MKNRTRYVIVLLGFAGLVAALGVYGHGWRQGNSIGHLPALLGPLSEELELNTAQQEKLEHVVSTLKRQHESMRPQHKQRQQAILALLESPVLDQSRALGLVQDTSAHIAQQAPPVIAAFADFYNALTPSQQTSLRQRIAERMERGGRGYRHWHD